MPLCVIVTRDVEMRYRGFIGSAMLEIAPGVYVGTKLSKAVRERVWTVLADWHAQLRSGSVVMTWRDSTAPGGIRILTLGEPAKELVEYEGSLLVRRDA